MQDPHLHPAKADDLSDPCTANTCGRRVFLGAAIALAPCLTVAGRAADASDMPPQPGDHLVFLTGAKKGEVIHSEDLVLGGPQIQAYPASPDGVLRNGSRLNLVIVVRTGSEHLTTATAADAADGVVAYSAVCTHQGCPVNMWSAEQAAFVCSCHASTYDPRNGAEVISGPAPRALPALPLKSENGVLIVAAPFTGQVGARQV